MVVAAVAAAMKGDIYGIEVNRSAEVQIRQAVRRRGRKSMARLREMIRWGPERKKGHKGPRCDQFDIVKTIDIDVPRPSHIST